MKLRQLARLLPVPVVVLALALFAAACQGSGEETATGLVVDVEGDLTSVTSFTVLTEEGERLTLAPHPEGDFAFPLPHLRDHLRSGEPVIVEYVEREGARFAIAVDDADQGHRLP